MRDLVLGFVGITVFGILLAKLSETRRGMWIAAGLYLLVIVVLVRCIGGYPSGPLELR